jgi:hypothetical protein
MESGSIQLTSALGGCQQPPESERPGTALPFCTDTYDEPRLVLDNGHRGELPGYFHRRAGVVLLNIFTNGHKVSDAGLLCTP